MKIKCNKCGGDVIVKEGSRMGICTSCKAEIPVPEDKAQVTGSYSEARRLLSGGKFEKAMEEFGNILADHPTEAAACLGMMMCELKVPGIEALRRYAGDIRENDFYKKALALAKGKEKARYEAVAERCLENLHRKDAMESNRERQNKIGREIVEEIEDLDSSNPVVQKFEEEKKYGIKLRREIREEEKRQAMGMWSELFLLSAFLLPFLYDKVGRADGSEFPMMIFMVVSVICTYITLAKAVEKIFNRDYIVLTLCFIALYALAVWKFYHIVWLVLLGANLIYYLCYGIRRHLRKAGLRRKRAELMQKKENRAVFGVFLRKEAASLLEERMKECRKAYNNPQEFEEVLEGWIAEAGIAIDDRLGELYKSERR